ncbi:hypothetical protein [Streptomyces parvus]|uniref:hypothetical protein n=1 Tax=Streptomyces parvus TaxID=66428 RepID=UPI00363A5CD6
MAFLPREISGRSLGWFDHYQPADVTVATWGAAMFFTVCGGTCLLAAVFGVAVPVLRRAELRKSGAAPSASASESAPESASAER